MATLLGVFKGTPTLVSLMTGEPGYGFSRCTPHPSRQGSPDTSSEDRPYSSQLSLLGERYTPKVMICKAICECMADVALPQKEP